MEDFTLDLMLDSGPQARSVQVKLNPFHPHWGNHSNGITALAGRLDLALDLRAAWITMIHQSSCCKYSFSILFNP